MPIHFRIRDFAYPFSILKLKRIFDRNQWLSEEALYHYQEQRLKQIITHAYENVPYYQDLFKKNNIAPSDIKTIEDLKNIPYLTKDILRDNFDSLIARNAEKFKPNLVATSGATVGRVFFYVDKPSNVLEFVHYWRAWGWAGYRLGDTFAILTPQFFVFIKKNSKAMYHFDPLTRKLTLNSLFISPTYVKEIIQLFRKYKPKFLKGIPSYLYILALVFNEETNHKISFKAIFSQGENLFLHQRELIEKVFSCKVYDSYGHMERTVAISQCPLGTYHIHLDYGILEFEEPQLPLVNEDDGDTFIKEIVGTSLYNYSMPLIRYKTGDYVELNRSLQKCFCEKGFSIVSSIVGREIDVIITRDRRAVTGLFGVFDHTPGILMGQIIQEDIDHLLVKVVPVSQNVSHIDRILINNIRAFIGPAMSIKIEHTTIDGIRKDKFKKFKAVVSKIPIENILG